MKKEPADIIGEYISWTLVRASPQVTAAGNGTAADEIIAELDAAGFVIVPKREGPLVQIRPPHGQGQFVLYNLRWEGDRPLFARVIDDRKPFRAVWVDSRSDETSEEWHARFLAELAKAEAENAA